MFESACIFKRPCVFTTRALYLSLLTLVVVPILPDMCFYPRNRLVPRFERRLGMCNPAEYAGFMQGMNPLLLFCLYHTKIYLFISCYV